MGANSSSLTARLAETCVGFPDLPLPPAVERRTKLILLDTLGAMLSAARPVFPGTGRLSEFVRQDGASGPCTIVGTSLRTSPTNAALMNGYLAYALDIESHHGPAVVHAAAAVLPAVLAASELSGSNGAAALTAFALGVDVACRVSLAIGPNDLYHRGFHPTSIAGSFGAAVAAATLFELDAPTLTRALGLAATQTGGLLAWTSDDTEESRPFNPGLAARNGLTAARLAALGFGAPRNVLDPEAKYNVFLAWSLDEAGSPERLLAGFAESFAISALTIKQHACCAFLHPAIDGLFSIMSETDLNHEDIAGITIRFPRSGAPVIDANPLRSHRAQYILPVAAVRRAVDFADVIVDHSSEPEIARLIDATEFIQDDGLDHFYPGRYATAISVTTRAGATHARRVDWARGTPENPMSDDEVLDKFRWLAGQSLLASRAEEIIALVLGLEAAASLTDLLKAIRI